MTGLTEHSAGINMATDVLSAAKRRHTRRTAMFRAAYATAALAIAGTLAVVATNGGGAPGQAPAVAAQSPALQLAAAAAASDNISYHLKVTAGWAKQPGPLTAISPLDGAFDPATSTGFLANAERSLDERLINGTLYERGTSDHSEPFLQHTGRFESLRITNILGPTGLQSADPVRLVAALKQNNATITENPGGGFHYTFGSASGDITLDASGRIAKVTYEATLPEGGRGQVTIELSGYGTAVRVEIPAHVRIYHD